jgi:hypothetical protein
MQSQSLLLVHGRMAKPERKNSHSLKLGRMNGFIRMAIPTNGTLNRRTKR